VQRDTFYQPIRVWEPEPDPNAPANGERSEILEKNLATA